MALFDKRLKGVSEPARRRQAMLRYRCNTSCNFIRHVNDGKCSLAGCSGFDSHLHVVSACKNPKISAMIIDKHNGGAQLVLRAFREMCSFGGSTCYSNVGNSDISAHGRTLQPFLQLGSYWLNKFPDIVIIKGWLQAHADADTFPTPSARFTVIPIEYKTCDDFKFAETLQQNVYDKYSPNHLSPRPQRPNLLTDLRAKGWRVLGLNLLDNSVGDSPLHTSMLTVAVGHGAFVPNLSVRTCFRDTFELPADTADELALSLVRHQTLSNYRISCTASHERGGFTAPPSFAPPTRHPASGVG